MSDKTVFINSAGESTDIPWMGNWLWLIINEYNGATFFLDEEEARDRLTRNDKLFKLRLSDWEQLV